MNIPFYLGFESSKGCRGSDLLWTVVFSFNLRMRGVQPRWTIKPSVKSADPVQAREQFNQTKPSVCENKHQQNETSVSPGKKLNKNKIVYTAEHLWSKQSILSYSVNLMGLERHSTTENAYLSVNLNENYQPTWEKANIIITGACHTS